MAISFTAGQSVTAVMLNLLAPIYVTKPSNQQVLNSTTLTNDTALVVTLAANQTWRIDAFILAANQNTTATLPALRSAWTTTGTLTGIVRLVDGSTDTTANYTSWSNHTTQDRSLTLATQNLNVLDVNANVIRETLIVTGGASGGVLQYQFAQFTANASNATIVQAGSFLEITALA